MTTDPVLLVPRLQAYERGKRIVVLGLLLAVYAGGWLLVSWRASRVGETVCTIQRVPDRALCAAAHHAPDGLEHTTPWDDCSRPTRWPVLPVGGTLPCSYYVSDPDQIFFETRPPVLWRTPGKLAFLALGIVLVASGVGVAMRGRLRSAGPPSPQDDPYRAAGVALPPPGGDRLPLVVPRAQRTGCLQWLLVTPFAVLGVVMSALLLYLDWYDTGEEQLFGLVLVLFAHALTFLALRGLFYRAGLVLDARRGLLFSWWGIVWPWFRRHEALSSLQGVTFSSEKHGRGITRHWMELRLERGRTMRLDWPQARDANQEMGRVAQRIREYAGLPDHGSGLGPPLGFDLGPPGIL